MEKVISKKDGTAWEGSVIMLLDCGKILKWLGQYIQSYCQRQKMALEYGFGIIFGVVICCSKTYPEHSFL